MANKLRDCFNNEPPSQEIIAWIQKSEEEARQKKECIVCSHYSYDLNVPGVVLYQGDCDLGHTAWFGKSNHCKDWTDIRGEE